MSPVKIHPASHLRRRLRWGTAWAFLLTLRCLPLVAAAEPIVLAGPAMGTTYRVTLAAPLPTHRRGEVHREIEEVLARIDAAASAWRDDSDVSRFHRSPAGIWIEVADDLAALVEIAISVHEQTEGRFDITVGPLLDLWQHAQKTHTPPTPGQLATARTTVGMSLLEVRRSQDGPAWLRKTQPEVTLSLGGLGPGYAVDAIGERLTSLGSAHHLVVLGGEARAWGQQADGRPWEVVLNRPRNESPVGSPETCVLLADGEAIAFSTPRPGISPIDPLSGRPGRLPAEPIMARHSSCAVADALAVAEAVARSRQHAAQQQQP